MTLPVEPDPAAVMPPCPGWCLGMHGGNGAHVSAEGRVGDLLVEVIRYPEDERVYVSLLDLDEGGRFLTVPIAVVPLIATTVLRLMAHVDAT